MATASQLQDRLVEELGQAGNPRFEFFLTTYWEDREGAISTVRQYLSAKLDAIDFLLGQEWTSIDVGTGSVTGKTSLSQRTLQLRELRKEVAAKLNASAGLATARPTRGTTS